MLCHTSRVLYLLHYTPESVFWLEYCGKFWFEHKDFHVVESFSKFLFLFYFSHKDHSQAMIWMSANTTCLTEPHWMWYRSIGHPYQTWCCKTGLLDCVDKCWGTKIRWLVIHLANVCIDTWPWDSSGDLSHDQARDHKGHKGHMCAPIG